MPEPTFTFPVIGVLHSCFRAKFGIPRQPGLIPEATGAIELLPPYDQPNAVRGLEDFSHLWVLFVFHEAIRDAWKATVRPPRLGGDQRIGVFASRSPFRPSPIGMSVVRLRNIRCGHGKVVLEIDGVDILDNTPVLDLKPYLPYSDIVPAATGGFAPAAPAAEALPTSFTPAAEAKAKAVEKRFPGFQELARKVVSADPRPAYQREPGRVYGVFLHDYEVVWEVDEASAIIVDIRRASPPPKAEG
ncbi:MAG: tRNA (N6-threonylcarbamoyladenosine(37)-N6)-methyltransferase TrmO [Lentisphaerae bacterium]|jgi:tRNA-Thr(GGU) m(6)t(6)A37 methyltransferase TsaA|nr:tRNA (N6-threonylcarbamoyladenosine(37)-N6)-methyltransferase TrmO [Lentisphaerota bacterium]